MNDVWGPNQRNLIQTVRDHVGCSLLERREELAALVCFPGDDPAQDVQIRTNCGMFALGVWRRCGVDHPLLQGRYRSGMAIAWVLKIARDNGALRRATTQDGPPPAGALLHWANDGRPNDHVAFCISDPDEQHLVDIAGGGAKDNAITCARGPWSWNFGRPLQHWVDPIALFQEAP